MSKRNGFFKFVVPSVLAFALSGVYTIVDGFFIGNSLGDAGLASITLGYPISAFVQAAGTGIGLSGAIRFTILRGQQKEEDAKRCLGSTVLLFALASMLLTGLALLFLSPLLRILGAEGEVLGMTAEYVRIIALGAVFQIFSTGLVPFIRNLGGASFAMFSMGSGFLTNIILDYLLVWVYPWGMAGAALATILGQAVTMLAAAAFLVNKRPGFSIPALRELPAFFGRILKVSVAPFGLIFSPQITAVFMNRFLMLYGGDRAVAVYGCISYITAIVYLLLQGVGDGSQPLISRYFSENRFPVMKQMRKLAYLSSGAIAAACMAGLFLTRGFVGVVFGASETTNLEVALYLPLFLLTLLPLAYVRITTAFLYATEKSALSYLLVYAEPVLIFILLLILPRIPAFGFVGVWLSVPAAQLLTWCVAVFVKHRVDAAYRPAEAHGTKMCAE